MAAPKELLKRVPLFQGLDERQLETLARNFTDRTFTAGQQMTSEGGGGRTATITAQTDVKCYGLTPWQFRPLVEENASIAWPLLQQLARRLREAEQLHH